MISDELSNAAIKKYDLPKNWKWKKANKNIKNGITLTGKCEEVFEDEDVKHLLIRSYFISYEEIKNYKEV